MIEEKIKALFLFLVFFYEIPCLFVCLFVFSFQKSVCAQLSLVPPPAAGFLFISDIV